MKNYESENKSLENEVLKMISQNKYIRQVIIEIILFPLFTLLFYGVTKDSINPYDVMKNVCFTVFGFNQAFFILIAPYLVNDKKSYLVSQQKIYELKTSKKVKKSHVEDLKKIDCRIYFDSQMLNYLYWSILVLSTEFCITLILLMFVPNQRLITSLFCGQITAGIFFMLSSCILLGFRFYTANLNQMYHDMLTKETELEKLTNSND